MSDNGLYWRRSGLIPQRFKRAENLHNALMPNYFIPCLITRFYSFVKNNTQMCNYFMKIFVYNTQLSYICRVIQN